MLVEFLWQKKEDVQNATVIIITTAWMLHCHYLFPTAVFCRKPSLIFVVVQLCKSFTAQNFNLSASCLVYKLVPTILINSSLYLLFHKLMDEKFYKSEKKKIVFPPRGGISMSLLKVSRISHLNESHHNTIWLPEAYLIFPLPLLNFTLF